MIDLHDYKSWDRSNGTLSVSLNPENKVQDSSLYVVLNGNVGNFCLDYSQDPLDKRIANQRAWSSDTGFYVKLNPDKITVTRWWDSSTEEIPYRTVQENPRKFYNALIKLTPQLSGGVISFSKEAFRRLRNCILLSDNGQVSLRVFMYLLAALADDAETPARVDKGKWHLNEFNPDWITIHDWEWLYESFKKGTNEISPLLNLVLRHASNRLFQEAHREATRKDFQTALWGGSDRLYNSGISEGAFYTPTSLVRTIVQEALYSLNKVKPLSERGRIRVLDPACGSAEFLREILRQLRMKKYSGSVELSGWDISEIACEMSNFVLNYENNSEWEGKVKISIIRRDSLIHNWEEDGYYDVILMNPPFGVYWNLGKRRSLVLDQLNGIIKGQPDLSSVFWKKAAERTAKDGVHGLILPHSLLIAETYKKLRTYIKEDLGLDFSLIARLGSSGLFEKAMIIPAVLIGTKAKQPYSHTLLWTDHQQLSVYDALRDLRIYRQSDLPTPITYSNYSIYENEALTRKDAWTVKSFQIKRLEERLSGICKVESLFNVRRGSDTGNNAAFILTNEIWSSLPENEMVFFRPCVMSESIVSGRLNDSYYMFFPYGNNKLSSEDELYLRLPVYSKTLSKHRDQLKKRKGREERWWELNRYRQWQLDHRPKLISAHFGKSGYFAFDQKGEYLVGQSFAWVPKKAEMDREDYYFSYLALLHAPLIDAFLEMTCNVLDGGYYDLAKRYVDKLPLPDLSKANASILRQLISMGKKIQVGTEIDRDQLNQIVANAYGISLESLKMDY